VAIVLGEENLWFRLFVAFPSVGALNITMGYPSKNNPAQILIAKLFKMHTNALARNAKIMLYYKDVLDILTHPLVEPYAQTSTLVNSSIKITTLYPSQSDGIESQPTDLFLLLFKMGKARLLS
jgi:hypothetical protein